MISENDVSIKSDDKEKLLCSLIITVYNQAQQLALVLKSVELQTEQRFELIIADDGSSDNTQEIVDAYKKSNPKKLVKYIWHEDLGFRKSMVQNEACRQSSTDYLIFIDGDMILDEQLVAMHLAYRKPKRVLCGHRGIKLEENFTQQLLAGKAKLKTDFFSLRKIAKQNGLTRPARGLKIKNTLLRKLFVPSRKGLSGCNFSLYKSDLLEVNGLDEAIVEYGYEDYELGHRLVLAGNELFNVSKLANTFHLYHESKRKESAAKLREKIEQNTAIRAEKGIEQ